MARELEKRLTEWAVWFHQNKPRLQPDNLRKRLDFAEKAIDGLLECMAIAAEDIRTLEGRQKSARLWLPSGIQVNGDMREFR